MVYLLTYDIVENYNISLTGNKANWGWFPLLIMIPSEVAVRSLQFNQIILWKKNIFETTNQMMVVHLDSPGESSHHPPTPAPQQRQAQELR